MDVQALQPCKILLVVTNYGIVGYLLVLIYKHISSHYDLKSFSFIFHVLCTIWLIVRGIFWISTLTESENWTPGLYYFLYWMPVPIEFASFLLFPLYFMQIIYPVEWRQYEDLIIPAYGFVIAILLSFQAIFIMVDLMYQNEATRECVHYYPHLQHMPRECFEMDINNQFFRAVTTCCFLLLATIQSVYALKLHTVSQIRYSRYLSVSQESMFYVNCVLVASFASRSLYQLLAMFDIFALPDVPLSVDGDCPLTVFLFFELWDYVPAILLITTVTSRSMSDDTAAHRNLNIHQMSRQVLWGPKHATYGTISAEEDENDRFFGPTLPENEAEMTDFAHGSVAQEIKQPSRNGSLSKRDGSLSKKDNSYERENSSIKDLAAHSIVERFTNPDSLIPTDSALIVKEAARSWVGAGTPPSNAGSYSNTSAASSIYLYALSHGYHSGGGGGSGNSIASGVSGNVKIPGGGDTAGGSGGVVGKGARSGSYTSPYGSGSGTPPGAAVLNTQAHSHNTASGGLPTAPSTSSVSSSMATSGASSVVSHSLLERHSGLLAYHQRQQQALLDASAGAGGVHAPAHMHSTLPLHAPHGANVHNPHGAAESPRHQQARSYSISSTESTSYMSSNKPLRPVISPKSSMNKMLPRPAHTTNGGSSAGGGMSGNGIGMTSSVNSAEYVSTEGSVAHDTYTTTTQPLHSALDNTPLTMTNESVEEENEWQVEPGTSHEGAHLLRALHAQQTHHDLGRHPLQSQHATHLPQAAHATHNALAPLAPHAPHAPHGVLTTQYADQDYDPSQYTPALHTLPTVHAIHTEYVQQPRYLQQDYLQHQHQQQALYAQQRQHAARLQLSPPPYHPSDEANIHTVPVYVNNTTSGAHVNNSANTGSGVAPGTSPSWLHLTVSPPSAAAMYQQNITFSARTNNANNTTTNPATANTTTLPPGQYLVPLPLLQTQSLPQPPQMALTAVPSPFSMNGSTGSLEFSNDTSPSLHSLHSLHALSTSLGGGSRGGYAYQYEEHSTLDSGIGMGNLPLPPSLSRTHSGVSGSAASSVPNSPQLRTMAPCPRRFSAPSRHLGLGFETPSPRRQQLDGLLLQGQGSHTGSYGSAQGLFDRDGTTSFSPSFIAELDAERDVYLHAQSQGHGQDIHAQSGDYMRNNTAPSNSNGSNAVYPPYTTTYSAPYVNSNFAPHIAHYSYAPTTTHSTHAVTTANNNISSRSALQVSTPERQEAARANALIREDHNHRDKFRESF